MSKYRPALAFRLAGLKSAIVIAIALAWWIGTGGTAAYSVMLGGVAIIVPNLLFSYGLLAKAEAVKDAQAARHMGYAFFLGGLVKLLLIAVLTVGFILMMPVLLLPYMCGFMGALLAFWLAPAVLSI